MSDDVRDDVWADLGGGVRTGEGSGPLVHECERGWLGEDLEGRLVPCLVCRPHLRRELDRSGVAAWRSQGRKGER